jgi:hypothetical protein
VTLHTLGDPIVPYWHQPLYRRKVEGQGDAALHTNIPVLRRYGHCNFSAPQVLFGFVLLVRAVTGQPIPNAEQVLPTAQERDEYRNLATSYELLFDIDHKINLPNTP